jgi:hypothetical protein
MEDSPGMPHVQNLSLLSILFALLGLPLAIQDSRDNSVSTVFLALAFSAWCLGSLAMGTELMRAIAVAVILLAGALSLFAIPGKLGEADLVFMGGMAAIFPFPQLMLALGLACVAGLAAFAWLLRLGAKDTLARPLPFLPSLYWGGLTVILGGIRL